MGKVRSRKTGRRKDQLRPEYRFDYLNAKPNRFASRMSGDTVAIVLDPDVAEVFNDAESVNDLLRSVARVVRPTRAARRPRSRAKGAKKAVKAARR